MNLLDKLSNKFFYHLIGPLQPYFQRRLQEAQVNVKEGTIQDIAFSPEVRSAPFNPTLWKQQVLTVCHQFVCILA